jgi:protein O-GlcNAcase/histone acetyltransferase
VEAAAGHGVTFYYGISPGQDMRYSEPRELDLLITKTRQLKELGCRGFAVLWDDIEPELGEEDAKHFDSFSAAHCFVTNRLHEALDQPRLLLCPVEYCASRADPDVTGSEYLATLGSRLHTDIQVFWTGAKVVSETITAAECAELTAVLRRRPILWDNLHANDYDQGRLLLGPFIGRDPQPATYLAGAMTNPNCEYGLNIPAILTLADWAGTTGQLWEPSGLPAQARAVAALLEESRKGARPEEGDGGLTEEDWDVVCQFFWLPHSHGPMVTRLLEDFRWCRDAAPAVRGWRACPPGEQVWPSSHIPPSSHSRTQWTSGWSARPGSAASASSSRTSATPSPRFLTGSCSMT